MDDRPAHFLCHMRPNSRSVSPPPYRPPDKQMPPRWRIIINDGSPFFNDWGHWSVTVVAEEECDQKQPLLAKASRHFMRGNSLSDPKPQEDEPCERLTFRQKIKKRLRKCKGRFNRSKDGDTGCRKFFGRRCRREKCPRWKRALVFLKLCLLGDDYFFCIEVLYGLHPHQCAFPPNPPLLICFLITFSLWLCYVTNKSTK